MYRHNSNVLYGQAEGENKNGNTSCRDTRINNDQIGRIQGPNLFVHKYCPINLTQEITE